jgi:hypothetical protein
MSKQAQNTTIAELQAAIAGVQKRFPNQQFTLGGKAFTTAQLVALFQSLIDVMKAAVAASAARSKAVADVKSLKATVMPVHADLLAFVEATLGRDPTVLADFGEQPKARKTPTAAEKAAAVQKREATRVARHTSGPVQKKAVKGTETTPAQPSASSATATPNKA